MAGTVEVVVGVVGRAHGIRGEVAVQLRTDEPERRFAPGQLLRDETSRHPLTVAATREHAGRWLVRFEGLTDRTEVEGLRGVRLVADVAEDELPSEPEEYYDRQLVGLRVLDARGTEAGQVAAVRHLPEQDLLEVRTRTDLRLVPFVSALVPEVDLQVGTLRLADVPGLLVDEDEDDKA